MIVLTKLNGTGFVLNAEIIRTLESTPDTTIRLQGGDALMVQESPEEVVRRSIEYGRLLRGLEPVI